ncbi:MAG: hypothetical protein M0P91_05250 [Sulfuricurvum sp.]|jgi:hypothetical protein|uniref:major capsid protein n=1 Tax=Sulfuricurvum sp. TaxID=2025608 RepID=UPI0025E7CFE7|nr:major capsid protein [Sulfuricurvum sp.]MCK9372582.1 hypothetical protein [Sulfuricurvum sp.]
MATKYPFTITPELTAISIAYRNKAMIADTVLPRVPVGSRSFKYMTYPIGESFTVPDTKVGRKSKPNQVEFSATEQTASVDDYGLDDPIPNDDIAAAPANYDPKGNAIMGITNLIELDREVRTAGLVFNANNYAAANKIVLSGSSQFSDPTSDPIKTIMDALDAMVMRPNIMTIGRAAFSALIRHPKIVKAVLGNAGDSGIARREDIAALFELEAIAVGESFVNTARKGQTVAMQRVWGKHISLLYRDQLANTQSGTTFGFTAQFGDRLGMEREDGDIGLRGGIVVRAGESVKELITAPDLGYFIQNVIA